MKILVIGATGHVGSYLVKELVKENHQVIAVSRGGKKAYGYDESIWNKVQCVNMTREELENSDFITNTNAQVVCDLIAFTLDGVKKVVSKIKNDAFYLQMGSIWTYENKVYLPVDELHPKNSTQEYGKQKGLIEDYLLDLSKKGKLRTTVIHAGHVSAKEWQPINPQGNLDITVFKKIKNGEQIVLPYLGLNTLQHIHAEDLAKTVVACIDNQDKANGEAFICTAEKAMTLRAICEDLYAYFGKTPNINYVSWEEFEKIVGKENALDTLDHISHSPCCTIEKLKKVLGVKIKYDIPMIYREFIQFNKI